MSLLAVENVCGRKWFVRLHAPFFDDCTTEKAAWLQANKRLQKLADQAKARYEEMK